MDRQVGPKLSVFLGERLLGELERRGPTRYRFAYSGQALDAHEEGTAVISASLPIQAEPFTPSQSAPFFEGLLPEGAVRAVISRSLRRSEADGFGLLEELGSDCAGAVVILPANAAPPVPGRGRVRELAPEDLERRVADLPRQPLGVSADPRGVRLSLGGVQHKLVLVRSEPGRFGEPLEGAPSSCLLKPSYGEYEDLVVNEHFCMRVASAMGLQVATTEIVQVGSVACLYVERFDRIRDGSGQLVRIHQEDMCQALGVHPAAKYEADGGPSAADVVGLLRSLGSARAARDINDFVKAVLVNFLLGNSDAHGKNFSLLYDPEVAVRLAPFYDIVSTGVYQDLTPRMAMTIGGVDDPAAVDLAAWRRLAETAGLGGQLPGLVRRWAAEMPLRAEEVRETAKAENWHRPVIDAIVDLCRNRAQRLSTA